VRRLLAGALLVASCTFGGAPQSPAPPAELIVVGNSNGSWTILRSVTGATVTTLPPGPFVYDLSPGGDVAEAYSLFNTGADEWEIDRLVPEHGYSLEKVATHRGPWQGVALLPAPGLTTFVGDRTVLVITAPDGSMTGYQHGGRTWSGGPSPSVGLFRVTDSQVLVGDTSAAWRRFDPATGKLGDQVTPVPCQPGPLANLGGRLYTDCNGVLTPGGLTIGSTLGRPPAVLEKGGAAFVYTDGGSIWRLDSAGARKSGAGPGWRLQPIEAPDGSGFFAITAAGIEKVGLDGSHHRVASQREIRSIATSRDGNFLYALVAGRLLTFSVATGAEVASFDTSGQDIRAVAGG
jgi:hypothetical protein